MNLRPYQSEARLAIEREWADGRRRTLLVLPTGCGKTVVFAAVAQDEVRSGGNVLILAHREELLEQAAAKLEAFAGLGCAVEKADQTSENTPYRVTVGSVQSMTSEKRLARFADNHYTTIVVDEAHHACADSYKRVLEHFPNAKILGVTATPDRADRKNLGRVFDSVAYEYSLIGAINDGYLSPIRALTLPLNINLENVKVTAGDYSADDLGNALDPYLAAIADHIAEIGKERKTVVFLPLVSTSQQFCEMLKARGMNALEVNGNTQNRKEVLARFDAAGKGSVICNSMLLTEGWDCPSVDCIVVLRPTKSRALYSQMVGRGTRLADNKNELLLLDFLWMTGKHSLCRPAHLVAQSDEVAAKMTERINTAGGATDINEALELANKDVKAERERKLADELKAARRSKSRLVDPLQYEYSINSADLMNYIPTMAWEMAPASEKQLAMLEGRGIDGSKVTCAGQASLIIDKLVKRQKANLATPKQIRLLENKGFLNVGEWRKDEASAIVGKLAKMHWNASRLRLGCKPHEYVPPSLKDKYEPVG